MWQSPQYLEVAYHGDTPVTVAIDPATNITGYTLTFVVLDGTTDIATAIITVTNATTGAFQTTLSPDGFTLAPGATINPERCYDFQFRRTNDGARDPFVAYGPIRFKVG